MSINSSMSFARRIVRDTGVLVSAAIRPDSVRALALEKAFLNFDVCVSRETLAELTTVLSRSTFDRYAPARQRDDVVAGFRARAVVRSRPHGCLGRGPRGYWRVA